MPDERCRILRRRLARREQLVNSRSRSKNEIHAVLQRRLQGKPPCSDLFGVKGRAWLAGLKLPLEERESVDAGIRHVEFPDSEIAAVERLIAQQSLSWPEIRRLMTVPGVNLICAASFIAAVGDPNRFLTSRRLVAYLGLDPKVRQSGEAPARSGRISKRGSAVGPLGAGRGRVDRGQPARAAARLLSANPSTPRSRQGDRRDRPQNRGPVLVHADPLTGLRPPTTLADQQETPPLEITAGAPKYTAGSRGIWSANDAVREAERALAEQAETSYKRMVQDQQAGGPARKAGASVTPEHA